MDKSVQGTSWYQSSIWMHYSITSQDGLYKYFPMLTFVDCCKALYAMIWKLFTMPSLHERVKSSKQVIININDICYYRNLR